jgi:hypothetical protein
MRDRSGMVRLFWFLILWMSTPQLSVSGFSIGSRVSSMRTFTVPMQERTDLASFIFHRQVFRDARERRVLSIWKLRLSSDFGPDFEKLSDEQKVQRLISAYNHQKEIADRQKEIADRQKEIADYTSGKRWALFKDLTTGMKTFDYQCALRSHSCLDDKLLDYPPFPLSGVDKSRSPPARYFETDVFGRPKSSQCELAHCISDSVLRQKIWNPVLRPMMAATLWKNSPLASPTRFDELLGFAIDGFQSTAKGNRVPHSGIINQPFNYVCMMNQKTWFDNRPSVMFYPMLGSRYSTDGTWYEDDFEAVCVADTEEVFLQIGAVIGTDPSNSIECDGNDPRVQAAFQAFNEVASVLIREVSRDAVSDQELAGDSNQLAAGLRRYFHDKRGFLAPFPSPDPNLKYRVVRFSKGVVLPVGGKDKTQAQGHPAPMPLLLIAKSLNAWLSYCLRQGKLAGLRTPAAYSGAALEGYCSILPSCDLDAALECPVCLAKLAMREHPIFHPVLRVRESYHALRRIASCEAAAPDSVHADPALATAASLLRSALYEQVGPFARDPARPQLTGPARQAGPDAALVREELMGLYSTSTPYAYE